MVHSKSTIQKLITELKQLISTQFNHYFRRS